MGEEVSELFAVQIRGNEEVHHAGEVGLVGF
jgi:hypothetical protein